MHRPPSLPELQSGMARSIIDGAVPDEVKPEQIPEVPFVLDDQYLPLYRHRFPIPQHTIGR